MDPPVPTPPPFSLAVYLFEPVDRALYAFYVDQPLRFISHKTTLSTDFVSSSYYKFGATLQPGFNRIFVCDFNPFAWISSVRLLEFLRFVSMDPMKTKVTVNGLS